MRQRHIPGVGAFVESLYTTLPALSIINFLSIITVLYATIKGYLLVWTPWMEFWMFICILAAVAGIVMTLVWKFVLPSVWIVRGRLLFGFQSDVSDKLDDILKALNELKKMEVAREPQIEEED